MNGIYTRVKTLIYGGTLMLIYWTVRLVVFVLGSAVLVKEKAK